MHTYTSSAAGQGRPIVANDIFLPANVHELCGNSAFLLALPGQPLHKKSFLPRFLNGRAEHSGG